MSLVLAAWASALLTAPVAGPAVQVDVGIQIIEATNEASASPPDSRAARDLSATLNYKSYRTQGQEQRTLGIEEWTTVTLSNGSTLSIAPKAVDKGAHNVRLHVAVHEGKHHLDTEYTVRDGGTVFISAGASGSGVLVVAIVPRAR